MQSLRLFRGSDLRLRSLPSVRFPRLRYFASDCLRFADNLEKSCDGPEKPGNGSIKVTVVGAAGRVGRTLSMLLKTSPLVDQLCMFDVDKSVKGFSIDVSHIDTKCRVSYVCGMGSVQEALDNPDVVLIAAGTPTSQLQGEKLFRKNAPIVAGLSEACARFCPEACFVLITNPINSLLPVAGEVFKLVTGRKQSEKLFGLTTLDVVRANTFTAEAIRCDPNKVIVPVVGGTSEDTIVPVISQMKPCCKIKHEEIVALTECVKQAEGSLTDCQNCGTRGSSSLSTAYAAFRFSSALISALKGEENVVECAYVQSDILPELEYLASPLILGPCGIEYNYGYPDLSEYEVSLMERAAPSLQRAIKMGKAYVIEQRGMHNRKRCRIAESEIDFSSSTNEENSSESRTIEGDKRGNKRDEREAFAGNGDGESDEAGNPWMKLFGSRQRKNRTNPQRRWYHAGYQTSRGEQWRGYSFASFSSAGDDPDRLPKGIETNAMSEDEHGLNTRERHRRVKKKLLRTRRERVKWDPFAEEGNELMQELEKLKMENRQLHARLSELERNESTPPQREPTILKKAWDLIRVAIGLEAASPTRKTPRFVSKCGVHYPKSKFPLPPRKVEQEESEGEIADDEELLTDVKFPFLANLLHLNECDFDGGRKEC